MHTQAGAIGTEQLLAVGYDEKSIARLVRDGVIRRRYQGVYLDALTSVPVRGQLFAALLAGGSTAFLSHRTALAVHGVRNTNLHRLEVTVVADHTPRRPGLFLHRTGSVPPLAELRTRHGLRVASPSRALVEVAHLERDAELDRLIAELARRRALDLEQIDAAIARRAGLAGIVRLRAGLARYRPPEHEDASTFERDFAAWLAADPAIPPPERNVRLGPWELDFHWPRQRVVAETDGSQYHRTPVELERDRVKDAWLQLRAIRVLRITDFRFAHDRLGIRADLLGMLEMAA